MSDLAQVVANLEAWLETMRAAPGSAAPGYGGPVVHWWQNCLQFTGAGLDWRYEGIIDGYLTLWRRTGEPRWLNKARRAGDDLVSGQLESGNYRHSSFELNPTSGGTPHEAAADVALLRLALALRAAGDDGWRPYAAAAENNLRCFYIERRWRSGRFWDNPGHTAFVPNKACTLAEALFVWGELRQTDAPIVQYALPTLRRVLALQVKENGRLHGGIAQAEQNGRVVHAYFPYYVARCIPALLLAYDFSGEPAWRTAALDAFAFVARFIDDRGLLPQVVYPRGMNRYPQWLAPLGDVLRVAALLQAATGETLPELRPTQQALLAAQLPTGGMAAGRGFGAQVNQRFSDNDAPDFRDCIPVAGWSDKAFRYLAAQVPAQASLPAPAVTGWETACRLRGRRGRWYEDAAVMQLTEDRQTKYLWRKGEAWAAVSAPEVMWK